MHDVMSLRNTRCDRRRGVGGEALSPIIGLRSPTRKVSNRTFASTVVRARVLSSKTRLQGVKLAKLMDYVPNGSFDALCQTWSILPTLSEFSGETLRGKNL